MKRVVLLMIVLALVLTGCGGAAADATVPAPPQSAAFEKTGSAQIDTIVENWQTQVPSQLVQQEIKQETIEQKIYQSSASLQEIAAFYSQLTANGWIETPRMPGLQSDAGFFASGYDQGNIHLAVGAIDATRFGKQGVVIYTAKGSK